MSDFITKKSPWLVLGLMAGFSIIPMMNYFFTPQDKNFFIEKRASFGNVDTRPAISNIKDYRKKGTLLNQSLRGNKVFGVLHDPAIFVDHMDKQFQLFASTHLNIPPDHKWQIGIYPMLTVDPLHPNDRARIGVYLIPTLLNTKTGRIRDFIEVVESADSGFYRKTINAPVILEDPIDATGIAFDEGHLWP